MSHDDVSPPLVFPAEYKAKILFWFHFVKYPLIFFVTNLLVVWLVLFLLELTNYLFKLNTNNNNNIEFSDMRQYVGIWSILSFVDVYLIYQYAIRVLETPSVSQLSDGTNRTNDRTTIGAQAKVSKKIDEILGRDVQRPGGSFLAAITWLVLIGVGTYGCTCSALFVFIGSPLFRRACTIDAAESIRQTTTGTSHDHDVDQNVEQFNNALNLHHIPDDLQEWAKIAHPLDEITENDFVQLKSGLSYSVVYDAYDHRAKLASRVTTAIDRQRIQLHSNVKSPYLLTGLTPTDDARLMRYESFCSLYFNFAEPLEHGRTKTAWFDYSILCDPPPSAYNYTNSFGNEIFPNVSLHKVMVPYYPNELYDGQVWNHLLHHDNAMSGASIVLSSKNERWVQLSYNHDSGPYNDQALTTR